MRRHEALKKANITHVVSVLRLPLERELFVKYKHLVVELDDLDEEDIIQHFATSNAFIKEGLGNGGGVLVHWYVRFSLAAVRFRRTSYYAKTSTFQHRFTLMQIFV